MAVLLAMTEKLRSSGPPVQIPPPWFSAELEPIELLATEYPGVDFIIPHMGSFADDWRAHITVIDALVRFPNLYADTSGIRRFGYLVQAVRRAGPAKLIFGSDGPWLHPGLELHKIRLLGLPADQEALIVGENMRRLLDLPDAAPPPQAQRGRAYASA